MPNASGFFVKNYYKYYIYIYELAVSGMEIIYNIQAEHFIYRFKEWNIMHTQNQANQKIAGRA